MHALLLANFGREVARSSQDNFFGLAKRLRVRVAVQLASRSTHQVVGRPAENALQVVRRKHRGAALVEAVNSEYVMSKGRHEEPQEGLQLACRYAVRQPRRWGKAFVELLNSGGEAKTFFPGARGCIRVAPV
jgi:hypothetical protein